MLSVPFSALRNSGLLISSHEVLELIHLDVVLHFLLGDKASAYPELPYIPYEKCSLGSMHQ
jgi:hypothetical protein